MKQKWNIAILAGGDSGEYEISIKSSEVVRNHLDPSIFDIYLIVFKEGNWFYTDNQGNKVYVDRDDFSLSINGIRITFDGVFIAIHGTPGEDGKVQGYLEMLGIPYTSCDSITSALTFDKFFCNHYVKSFGVKISKSIRLSKEEFVSADEILSQLNLPFFVKPDRGGSSVGTSKVNHRDGIAPALEKAFREDSLVIVEEHIPGRELSCGTISFKGKVITLPVTEIISKNEFFDYEAKYQGKSEEVTPADIPEAVANLIGETSLKLYKLLNCRGMVRFDYIWNETNLYFLEVNTVPGMSELSIVPQQALKAGISLRDLFTETMLAALKS